MLIGKMKKIKFDKKGFLIPQKINYDVEHDEETIELIENLKYNKNKKKK